MSHLAVKPSPILPSTLSVSYKSPVAPGDADNLSAEAFIITDLAFIVKGLNTVAENIYNTTITEAAGIQLFDLIPFELIGTTTDAIIETLLVHGFWKGDMIYQQEAGKFIFSTRCNLVKDATGKASSITIVMHNITERVMQEKEQASTATNYQTLVQSLKEGVMLINADGTITAANKKAAYLFGFNEDKIKGKPIFSPVWKIVKEDGSDFPISEYPPLLTIKNGTEYNNVIMGIGRRKDKKLWVSLSCRPIFEHSSDLPVAAVVSVVDIVASINLAEPIDEHEQLFRIFMKNSPAMSWIYNEDGVMIYGNPEFSAIVGIVEDAPEKNKGEVINSQEAIATILAHNKQVLSSEKPVIAEKEIIDKDGNTRYFLFYWFLLPVSHGKKLIGGHAVEITDSKKASKEISNVFERYTFAINASSDAIWDMDVATGIIYRSDNFIAFSGYRDEEINPTFDWFVEKIHLSDKTRVKANIDYCLENSITHWEIEYRFQIADGSYRHLLDKAYAIYEGGKLTRVIGAMQDITERKKLEAQLLYEQVQKQKMVNQAIIQAQEKERNRISGELHDNVNQLLMSAKLHICVAKTRAEGETDLLDKANQYLLMAVEEIRGLSKTLNSSVITNAGLLKSVTEIGATMMLLKNIHLHIYISENVIEKMSANQQMMVYRIIQEQSNNILKYAETQEAIISLKIVNNDFELIISDNGQGFDKNEKKVTGIGFINIFNRVDAYNGNVEIITSPGNGCTLLINFPLAEANTVI